MTDDEKKNYYTEYGYRGLEEIKKLEKVIEELKEENEKLRNSAYDYFLKSKEYTDGRSNN